MVLRVKLTLQACVQPRVWCRFTDYGLVTVIETLRVAVPPLPSLTMAVTEYVSAVDGAVQVTVLPVPEIEPPVYVQE
jgi:hypothetical protein